MNKNSDKRGVAIVVVLIFTLLAAVAIVVMASASAGHALRSRATLRNEQAFFIAEGGIEQAAEYVAGGGPTPMVITNALGNGSYTAFIRHQTPVGDKTVNGDLRINPNNAHHFSFFLIKPDGSMITRQDLLDGHEGYEGSARRVHFRPMGAGQQSFFVNGMAYNLQNNATCDIESETMNVRLYNDHPNQAMGHWRIEINAVNAVLTDGSAAAPSSRYTRYDIESFGRVGDQVRIVRVRGLHAVSWARFALWYDDEALQLWMVGGEIFHGPVHANTEFRFHRYMTEELGQTRFFDRASSTHDSYRISHNSVEPIFDRGLQLNAAAQDVTIIDLDELREGSGEHLAPADHVFDGPTTILLEGTNMIVSAPFMQTPLDEEVMPIPANGRVYVRDTTVSVTNSVWRWPHGWVDEVTEEDHPGSLTIGGPDGMDGRLTAIAEQDILITDHVRYSVDPMEHPESRDALGLIAGRHVVVQPEAPDDLEIFAHLICRDGGFGVANYNSGTQRGMLTVYGGIVNKTRQAVGTTSGTGYSKNYIYDTRFMTTPPPGYPVVENEYTWEGWEG